MAMVMYRQGSIEGTTYKQHYDNDVLQRGYSSTCVPALGSEISETMAGNHRKYLFNFCLIASNFDILEIILQNELN